MGFLKINWGYLNKILNSFEPEYNFGKFILANSLYWIYII